ncbi:MAG: hypothetical protein K8I00_07170, partial [Candidatus Omnitrophica bacterium]|nr:hypothetical protein [Candidatus Omnitrophota bacterium]
MKIPRIISHITKSRTIVAAVLALLFLSTGADPAFAVNDASFVAVDDVTQGNWKGVYGADGYNVIADMVSYPSYATVTPVGKSNYTWASNPADVRALERAGSGRIAATWYSPSTFEVDINISDGQTHQVAFYSVDWEPIGRVQTYEIFDGDTNVSLDTARLFTGFNGGQWIVYNISGHVKVRITKTVGANAVLSGIFFDALPTTCAISYGDYVTDTINPDGDVDACAFNATAGEQVVVPYRRISGTATFFPRVKIFDPDNIELGSHSGAGHRGELIVPITKTGVHRIEIDDSSGSGTGTYEYLLQSTNNPGNVTPVSYGDTVTGGIIDPEVDLDVYSFNGGAGDIALIPFHRTSGSQTFLTTVRVFDPSGNIVATQSSSGGDGELATTLLANGTHTIVVSDNDQNQTGGYEFSLHSPNNPTNVTPISYGDTITGQEINPAVDLDTYSFSGATNDKVALVYHKTG